MPYPQVRGEGNLTGDPDVKYLDNGSMVANVNVASTQRRFNKQSNEWEDAGTTFLRLTLWNEDADALLAWAGKGMAVRYEGALTIREFETNDGGKGKSVELQYPVVTPDPKRMDIQARKRQRDGQQQYGQGGGGGQGQGSRQGAPQGGGWGNRGQSGGGQSGGQQGMKEGSGWGRTSRGGGWGNQGGGQSGGQGGGDPWASAPAASNAHGYDDEPPF